MIMSVSPQSRPPIARRYKRYIVTGSVELESSSGKSRGTLLNVGKGGVLARADTIHREETELALHFHVAAYPETFAALGHVVGTKEDLLAIKFLEEPEGIAFLLDWLDLQHCIWSGVA